MPDEGWPSLAATYAQYSSTHTVDFTFFRLLIVVEMIGSEGRRTFWEKAATRLQ
jgi:hypothetical protein